MRFAILAALLLAGSTRAAFADPPADWKGVKVLPRLGAEVKVDDEAIDYTKGGFSFPWIVQEVDGESLMIGGQRKGWVDRSEVVKLDDAPAYFSQFTQRYRYESWAYGMRAIAYSLAGDFNSAIADYGVEIRLSPTAGTYNARGISWSNKKDFAKALADYRQAIRMRPTFSLAYNNAGWLRATCSSAAFRNGKEAVELATKACELTDFHESMYLDTLAAAYAEIEDFDSAVKYQNQAVEFNPTDAELKQHAELFKDHQPVRDE